MALRLCMEYLALTSKGNPISFALPQINNALDASKATGSILTASNEGSLTPIEATRLMGLIDSYSPLLS